jgi:ribosomal protein L37E
MTTYKLDLSTLSIQQMKDLIRIICPSCGEDGQHVNCGLCNACELECWSRKEPGGESGLEIVMCW